jgi:hypothetical protein
MVYVNVRDVDLLVAVEAGALLVAVQSVPTPRDRPTPVRARFDDERLGVDPVPWSLRGCVS